MESTAVQVGIWLSLAAVFGIGELTLVGTFFMLPFAVGALVAGISALFGAPIIVSFVLFMVVSFVVFLGFRPLARKLDNEVPQFRGIGANRLIGDDAVVIETIPAPPATGVVKVGAEDWRAQSNTGSILPKGTSVTVVEVRGTRVVVEPQ